MSNLPEDITEELAAEAKIDGKTETCNYQYTFKSK